MRNLKDYFSATANSLFLTFTLSIPAPLLADTSHSEWMEMVRACEAVILEQDFKPLENYEPAPLTYGMPDMRELGVYNASRNLIVTAREERGKWVHCLVREAKEERLVWREQAAQWEEGLKASFPRSEYIGVEWPYHPEFPFKGALRCQDGNPLLLVAPFLDDMVFRISVHNDFPSGAYDNCIKHLAQKGITE